MNSPAIKIFIADLIHPSGITLLEENGFDVIKAYSLSNKKLIKFISFFKNPASDTKNSVLILRTIRKLSKSDISSISRSSDIKLICAASSGYDNIDLKEAKKNNIHVMNVPDGTSIPAAEHTIALLLSITKNLVPANSDMKKGTFDFSRYSNNELFGKTIGIIGVGRVGSKVAKIAVAFGMNVIGNDINKKLAAKFRWIKFVSLKRLLETSDVITVHTPLDRTTKDLINSSNLKSVKKSCIILNCARGGIINETALINSLKHNRIFYTGIDVFENEPGFRKEFSKLQNVILTPHLAGKTVESKERVSRQLAGRITQYFSGRGKKSSDLLIE